MPANPIVAVIAQYLLDGKKVASVRPNHYVKPTAIIVKLKNGTEYSHDIEASDRAAFLKLWIPAAQQLRFSWDDWATPPDATGLVSPAQYTAKKKKKPKTK